jgi:1-acyl-sn-glycerol-3-phosphate acyltransferase
MAEGERPEGEGSGTAAAGARLRVYRGRGPRRMRATPVSAGEVSARLNALERRVEAALGRATAPSAGVGGDVVRAAVDETLAAWARLQRFAVRDLAAGLAARWAARSEARVVRTVDRALQTLYDYWWRVEPFGLERVPASGPVVLVANRSPGLVPYEALMLAVAVERETPARRRPRLLLDDWLAHVPLLGPALAREGAVRGTVANLRRLLAHGEAVVHFPEGGAVMTKTFADRYRLGRFERTAFARLAIETGTPIVPVAVIGAEEIHPVLARLDVPGRPLGVPPLPITPTFPWLGLAGLVPLPTKWTIHVGEPLDVGARHAPDDANDVACVGGLRDRVRERLQALVLEGLRRRHSIFLG